MTARRRPERAARRERTDRDTRRAELLDAAVAAIRRSGRGVSMEAIAAEAGVTKPILYRHFGDREGLVAAVAERFAGDLAKEIQAALGQVAEPRELLRSSIDAYLTFIERDPELYRFLVGRALSGAAAAGGTLVGLMATLGSQISVVLGEQLRAAGQDSGAAEPWAFGLVGMVHAAGDWWVERQTMPRARLADYLTQLVWDGLDGLVPPAP